jgi:uncharacterized protein
MSGKTHVEAHRFEAKGDAKLGIIDAFDFARLGKEASGRMPLVRFARAGEGLPLQPRDETGDVRWRVQGAIGGMGEPLLKLHVQANPVVVCQRCMEPFAYPVDIDVTLQLVKSEADLDDGGAGGTDADFDDEAGDDAELETGKSAGDMPEKILGSRRFDLLAQVEDELILSIPYVPRHDVCPGTAAKTSAGDPAPAKRPSPFAVLEKLKQKD